MTGNEPTPGGPAVGGGLVPEIRARLVVLSETLRPEVISERLALTPHSVNRMGDPLGRLRPKPVLKTNFWEGEFAKGNPWDIESYILTLLDGLGPHRAAVRDLQRAEATQVKILIGVDLYDSCGIVRVPSFGLSTEAIERLAEYGLALDTDVNVVAGD